MFFAQLFIDVLMVMLLLTVAYSDFKYRHVRLWQILAIACFMIINGFLHLSPLDFIKNWAFNIAIVFIQLLFVQIWFSLRNKETRSVVNRMIGMGDILFFALLAMYFEPYTFVLFITSSLLLVSFIYLLKATRSGKQQTIPLAGWWSVLLLPFFPLKYFLHLNHYFNVWLN